MVDALGDPLRMMLSAGHLHDIRLAEPLLETLEIEGSTIMADRGYDSSRLVSFIENRGARANIPGRKSNTIQRHCDWWLYKERRLIECFFQKLKCFRRVATRYDKPADSFLAFVHLACISILLA